MKKIYMALPVVFCCCFASAQTACDSLLIDVKYHAFSDSLIEINVVNNSSELFSYPGFVILDSNGDTVAKETVNFFGIAQSSTHLLNVYPGMPAASAFNGVLELWTDYYTNLACSYNLSFKLCPDTCMWAYPYLANMGGALSLGTVNWWITDSATITVATGSLTLDSNNQIDKDSVCLIPGSYTLYVDTQPPMMGQPFFGISNHLLMGGPQQFYSGAAAALPFIFYEVCIFITSAEQPDMLPEVLIYNNNGVLEFLNFDTKHKYRVSVYSMPGKLVYEGVHHALNNSINLSHLAEGVYIVKLQTGDKVMVKKVKR